MSAPLELRGVVKHFGARAALDGVSLDLLAGEVFGLLGPNGAGKTTLLRIAVDLLRPDRGEVRILGAPPGPGALEQIGYLPEERGLPVRPRVLDLLVYLGELKGQTRRDARAQAQRLLARVQLDARGRSRVGELSKGNQQKIQIAAALLGRPRLLLVDEPFSGLDPVNRALVVELLQESVREGAAVLISTHQLQEVQQLCDRMLLLNRGKVLLEGKVQEVRERYADGSLLVRGGGDYAQLPAVAQVAPANGAGQRLVLRGGATSAEVLRQIVERGLPLTSFEPHVPTVEEIFVRLVTEREGAAPMAEAVGG
ncbi:MAG: ATP-binding cassette domain-containing protein [Myxococcales bacterium]